MISTAGARSETRYERVVGSVRGESSGPTIIVVGGIHGNEPAGIRAAERVLARLSRDDAGIRGELVAFGGNLGALRLGRRYIDKDLNRLWSDEKIERAKKSPQRDAEDRELLDLLSAIEDTMARARGDVYVLDLHTTSAAGTPFVLFGDTRRQRRFGCSFPIPVVLGLEEQVEGVLSGCTNARGCVSVAIEGGQHDDPASIDNLEACIWIALVSAGAIEKQRLPEHDDAYRLLDRRRGSLPRVMEVTARQAITADDQFRMAPGFANLDHARAGQLLAHDKNGELRAPRDMLVILPLYQGLGSDGFFWGREVTARAMHLSDRLRALRVERLLPLLPFVREDDQGRLVARSFYPRELFHTLGYRRVHAESPELIVSRPRD
jgi:predicted deacylase